MTRQILIQLLIVLAGVACIVSNPARAQNLPTLGDSEREELTPLMERKVGEEIMHEIRRDPDYLDDAPLLEYLNMLGANLVDAKPEVRGEANYDFSFFAVRDPTLNAFALPGGFIAVHSALVLAAQSESELAGVMGHEVGHIAQRHIARMLGQQRQDFLIPLAAMALAVLAARSNSSSSSDAAGALVIGGEGLAMQRQLSFSRDAEREADRIGLQIMSAAGYDPSGMVSFFGRMQKATRAYSEVPAFLQNHPVTTERIADLQARIRSLPYKQHIDSVDFQLIRARLRILQDDSTQGLHDAGLFFEDQMEQNPRSQLAASKYGLALIAQKQGAYDKALVLLKESRAAARAELRPTAAQPTYEAIFDSLGIDIQLAAGHASEAARLAAQAREKFPISRGIAHQYADCLMAEGRNGDAVIYLRDQAQLYRQEPQIQALLAKAYAAEGKQALQHLALAESYALNGGLLPALEQLSIARKAPDASFYDNAVIDAREREFKEQWNDQQKDLKKSK
ncbi:MAG TPA: M48 family metalloprotease [Burkholderiaceae bacterium]|jgi:predicted Zn-dependent protease|nr:M48 family metalloprotease [Burkholderiaceae bacterium]